MFYPLQVSLVTPDDEQTKLWRTRLNELLIEGNGDLLFEVGVGDGKRTIVYLGAVRYYIYLWASCSLQCQESKIPVYPKFNTNLQ